MHTDTAPQRDIYSVSRLNTEVRAVLEGSFPLVWVEGEISNLSLPRSGHMYFSLKDAHAQVRCAMFRMKRQLLRFVPQDGRQVLIRARIGLYEARGEFQLIAEHMEPAGEGALRRAVEELKSRLGQEGLFDAAHKKELPRLPRRIGVVTSPTGAAVRDVLSVLRRRFAGIPVVVYPIPVQGREAAREISEMLRIADRRGDCDLLILTRGGGSLEDLMAFNDEQLARTIHTLETPLISAVGHEIDTTIADFVADRRAPTPSAAAELASPDAVELRQRVEQAALRLRRRLTTRLQQAGQRQQALEQRLQRIHPRQQLAQQQQHLDELELRLSALQKRRLAELGLRLAHLRHRLQQRHPARELAARGQRLSALRQRLQRRHPGLLLSRLGPELGGLERRLGQSMRHQLQRCGERLAARARNLEAVSPLATVQRGYAIVQTAEEGRLVRNANQVSPGDELDIHLAEGRLRAEVLPDNKGK